MPQAVGHLGYGVQYRDEISETIRQAAVEEWGKAVGSALKKVDVDDLGDMDAPTLLASMSTDASLDFGPVILTSA